MKSLLKFFIFVLVVFSLISALLAQEVRDAKSVTTSSDYVDFEIIKFTVDGKDVSITPHLKATKNNKHTVSILYNNRGPDIVRQALLLVYRDEELALREEITDILDRGRAETIKRKIELVPGTYTLKAKIVVEYKGIDINEDNNQVVGKVVVLPRKK